MILAELLEDALEADGRPVYYILDDAQHLTEGFELLTMLLGCLPRQVRLILLSRNRIFREVDRFRMGSSLYQIPMEALRLRRGEIVDYARLCGLTIDQARAEELERVSEGWVSLLYLLFRSHAQQGRWLLQTPDIFRFIPK